MGKTSQPGDQQGIDPDGLIGGQELVWRDPELQGASLLYQLQSLAFAKGTAEAQQVPVSHRLQGFLFIPIMLSEALS